MIENIAVEPAIILELLLLASVAPVTLLTLRAKVVCRAVVLVVNYSYFKGTGSVPGSCLGRKLYV